MPIRNLFLAAFFAGAATLSASAGAKPPPAVKPSIQGPQVTAGAIWNKLLTRCGDTYVYGGSVFDHGGMLSDVGAGSNPTVIEFKGVRFNIVPIRVTDAERLNGIQYRGRISMLAHVYRDNGGNWMDGPDLQPRNTDDIMGRALQDIAGDAGELGDGGAMAFELVQVKGSWAIGRSSTTMSGPLTFDTNYYYVQKIIEARTNRYDCKAGKMLPPPPTAAELAAKKAADAEAARKAAEAERQRKQDEAEADRNARAQAQEAAAIEARLAPWQFKGDAAAFRTAFIANLAKRAQEFGVDPNDYDEEIEAVMQIIKTCTALTQADYDNAKQFPYREEQRLLHDCDGSEQDISVWGTTISPKSKARWMQVSRSITGYDSSDNPAMADHFSLTVKFMMKGPEDAKAHGVTSMESIDAAYAIIDAEIPFTSAAR